MFFNAVILSWRAISRNLLRSFLTTLGVVIGVTAVITMVTLGNGATVQISKKISSLGSNLLMLRPGQSIGSSRSSSGSSPFRMSDVVALRDQINVLQGVAPYVRGRISALFGNRNWQTSVIGTINEYIQVGNWVISEGRGFEVHEEEGGAAVCIIGKTVRQQLYGDASPLGTDLRLGRIACQVIGVLSAKGQSAMGYDQDDRVLIPIKTAFRRIFGHQNVYMVMMSMKNDVDSETAIADIKSLMRERRHLAEEEGDNFTVIDTKEIANTMSSSINTMTGLLAAVAAVSLLVGGIGIMNIMLVSVTERTREIGIRLAIGALEKEVLMQFLIEAVVLSSLGGLLGIVLALFACWGIGEVVDIPFIFDLQINIVAFLFSASIGVVFGYVPAKRAANLDPIVALRYE